MKPMKPQMRLSMKPPLTNISVVQRPAPPPPARTVDAGTRAGNGNGQDSSTTPYNLNVTGAISYTGSSSVTIAGDVSIIGMIESPFLKAFRDKFIGSGAEPAWPRATVNTPAEFATEFTDLLRTLFLRREASVSPPDGAPGSAKQMIKELLDDTQWPDKIKSPVPEPWNSNGHFVAFRRYEIACALNILMQTYNSSGQGGGIGGYPPDH